MARSKIPLTLIHNAKAGDASHDRRVLMKLLGDAGYDVNYVRHKRDSLEDAFAQPAEIVVIAGGDGTVAKVVEQARPNGPPLAILPLGTANNIAKSLGIEQPVEALISGWRTAVARPFYPIDSEGPWGRRRLVEGIGFGAVEEAIAQLPDKTDRHSAYRGYAEAVMSDDPEWLELTIAGETTKGPFAVLEISAIPLVGPNLRLTATAAPSGREFTIGFIRESCEERQALRDWILAPPTDARPPLTMRQTDHVIISGRFERVRMDGSVKTAAAQKDWDCQKPITLSAAPEPLWFLGPE